jgi:hypothetical protein
MEPDNAARAWLAWLCRTILRLAANGDAASRKMAGSQMAAASSFERLDVPLFVSSPRDAFWADTLASTLTWSLVSRKFDHSPCWAGCSTAPHPALNKQKPGRKIAFNMWRTFYPTILDALDKLHDFYAARRSLNGLPP